MVFERIQSRVDGPVDLQDGLLQHIAQDADTHEPQSKDAEDNCTPLCAAACAHAKVTTRPPHCVAVACSGLERSPRGLSCARAKVMSCEDEPAS